MPPKLKRIWVLRVRRLVLRWRAVSRVHKQVFLIGFTVCCISFFLFQPNLFGNIFVKYLNPKKSNTLFRSCAHVSPRHLEHFAGPPMGTFSTFFGKYLFDPTAGKPLDLNKPDRPYSSDIQELLSLSEKALRKFTGDRSIVVHDYVYGYTHLGRRRGSTYVLYVRSSSSSSPDLRRNVLAFQNTFKGRCIISVKEVAANVMQQTVYMIVPYSERPERLRWFLKRFDTLRENGVQTELILALCGRNETDTAIATKFAQQLKEAENVHIASHKGSEFSRAICIREAMKTVSESSLVFITDIDMYIYPPLFERCRLNSIQGSQVYFPVFYNFFPGNERIEEGGGYWRDTSYGMSCMYKSDFDEVGAYDGPETRFSGWGGEDMLLKDAFVNHSRYEVFRAVEPSLRHKWHPKTCNSSSPFYEACAFVKTRQQGIPPHVVRILNEKHIDPETLFEQHSEDER